MKTKVDLRLIHEAHRFALRWSCDDCVHFTGRECANGWPGGQRSRPLEEGDEIVFCKEFDAG
jgi:hypothetical protein